MKDSFTQWIISHPWLTMILSLLLVVAAAAGLSRAHLITDYEVFFDGDNPRLMMLQEIEAAYGRRDTVQFNLALKQGSVFEPDNLAAIEWLSAEAWTIPHSRRVDSLTNFPYTRSVDDDFTVSDLFEDAQQLTPEAINQRRTYALAEPALQATVNEAGDASGVLVWITMEQGDSEVSRLVSDYARDLSARFEQAFPQYTVYLSGSVLLNEAFFDASTSGTGKLLLAMFVLMLVLVGLLLRSWVASVATLLLTIFSVLSGVGLASWLGIPFTAPSSSAPVMITVLCVANTIHIIATMLTQMRRGEQRQQALLHTVRLNLRPVALTSLTTIIGFLCLNTSDVPPYRYLGTTAALGVGMSLLLSFSFLLALLALAPMRVKVAASAADPTQDRWYRFGQFVVDHRNGLALSTLALVLGLTPFIALNKVDDRLITYFDEDVPIRVNTEFRMEHIGPFYNLSYSLTSQGPRGLTDPEFLHHFDRFISWVREQDEVMAVSTFSDTMKRVNRSMNGDDPTFYRMPEDEELAAQYLLLYELSLPFGLDLTNQVNIDKSATKVNVGLYNISSADMRAFAEKVDAWMVDNLPDYMVVPASGPPLLFAYIWSSATKSNILGMLLAVVLISGVIALAMRSMKLGLLSLIPNLTPALMAFGAWGLINGQLDIGSSIVAVISFGIIVDDTIHFLSKYQTARQQGLSAEAAVRQTIATVGRALFITSVTLVLGFSVLATSSFHLNSAMGQLTAMAIAFALYFDFFLLPVLLMKLDRKTFEAPADNAEEAAVSAV